MATYETVWNGVPWGYGDMSGTANWSGVSTSTTAATGWHVPEVQVVERVIETKPAVIKCEYCRRRNSADEHWDCEACGAPLP